jgi:hypothetical protein
MQAKSFCIHSVTIVHFRKQSQVSRSTYQTEDKQSKVRKDRSNIFREQMDIDPPFQAEDQNELRYEGKYPSF